MDYTLRAYKENIAQAVGNLIGTYTYPTGEEGPAIFVKDGNKELNPSIAVRGVEVVIEKIPVRARLVKQYQGNPMPATFTVRIVRWGSGSAMAAAAKIAAAFPNAAMYQVSVPEGLGPSEQAVVEIPQNVFGLASDGFAYPVPG